MKTYEPKGAILIQAKQLLYSPEELAFVLRLVDGNLGSEDDCDYTMESSTHCSVENRLDQEKQESRKAIRKGAQKR